MCCALRRVTDALYNVTLCVLYNVTHFVLYNVTHFVLYNVTRCCRYKDTCPCCMSFVTQINVSIKSYLSSYLEEQLNSIRLGLGFGV